MRLALIGLVLAAAPGCATFGALGTAPMPYSARVYLLDSEEDLMTAAARAEEATREIERVRGSLDEVKTRYSKLHDSPLTAEVKSEVVVEKARLARAQRAAELLTAAQVCAEDRYAAARAQALVRFKLEGARDSDPPRLADKAEVCESQLDKPREALAAAEDALARARSDRERESAQAAAVAPLQYPRPWVE
jgi:hypothetical protein